MRCSSLASFSVYELHKLPIFLSRGRTGYFIINKKCTFYRRFNDFWGDDIHKLTLRTCGVRCAPSPDQGANSLLKEAWRKPEDGTGPAV